MSKSIFTMSAAQRLRAQERQSRRFDRAVNKKFKQMKKAWKKRVAGKVIKGVAFVATAAAAGAVAGKVKEIVKTKSGDELREMAAKIKIKFEEKRAAGKSAAAVKTGADLGAGAANMDGVAAAVAANEAEKEMSEVVDVGMDVDESVVSAATVADTEEAMQAKAADADLADSTAE